MREPQSFEKVGRGLRDSGDSFERSFERVGRDLRESEKSFEGFETEWWGIILSKELLAKDPGSVTRRLTRSSLLFIAVGHFSAKFRKEYIVEK